MSSSTYLLAGQSSELERLQLQSRVWESSGLRLLAEIGHGRGGRAVDIGCGVMGWLRLLSEWVGPDGEVVGTDIDDAMLGAAKQLVAEDGLDNVLPRNDDLFATRLEPASFDLVHARFELTRWGVATTRWRLTFGCSAPEASSSWKIPIGDPGTSTRRRRRARS
jgi:SAM-dependent methyltransferase